MDKPGTDTARTIKRFMKSSMRIELTPLNSAPSLPVPIIVKRKPYLIFLFFIAKRLSRDERMKIYRPRSKFVVQFKTGKTVVYEDYSYKDDFPEQDWKSSIGEFPHEAISGLTLEQYKKKRGELVDLYDEAISAMLSSRHSDMKKEFIETFNLLCEPALFSFMKKLGTDFFHWMER